MGATAGAPPASPPPVLPGAGSFVVALRPPTLRASRPRTPVLRRSSSSLDVLGPRMRLSAPWAGGGGADAVGPGTVGDEKHMRGLLPIAKCAEVVNDLLAAPLFGLIL